MVFSIAAINDTDSKGQWEPLAPTKEAQEFHLSQTYHEGLLQLQAKEYTKARELLESVLKDPLILSAQVDNNASDGHLLQLRFLSLKNLASVFLQQGPAHYESALNCYLQAVEIDAKDSVVWNQLGTLACTMGLLSISRWAFEQGLFCSPNNWNCMEKLLEVLIAIGDEVACLSVAELILRHWPSHTRALHVKATIEESDPIPFAPRGIDKLEPKHVRLKFPGKRKSTGDDIDENVTSKRRNQNIELQLAEASWPALLDAVLSILLPTKGSSSETSENSHFTEKMDRYGDVRISIHLPLSSEIVMDSLEGKEVSTTAICENVSSSDYGFEEHPQERRSTRLRSRKPGKEESDFANSKDLSKVVLQSLEPFIVDRLGAKDPDCAEIYSVPGPSGVVGNLSDLECNDVRGFIMEASNNYGAYHMAHLLLEEVAHKNLPYQEIYIKLLELEKLTRHWGQDRTAECNLFLAELYFDVGSCCGNESKCSHFFCEASYHLCKVIELVALDCPSHLTRTYNMNTNSKIDLETNGSVRMGTHLDFMDGYGNISSNGSSQNSSILDVENSSCQETVVNNSLLTNKRNFWVRFFWLSGRLSLSSGDKGKAYEEFCVCLSLLKSERSENDTQGLVPLPHCKLVRGLTVERVMHEIHLLEVDSLLKKTTGEMIEKGMYLECVKLLSPLLLYTKDVYLDLLPGDYNEDKGATSVELLALDVLISACENAKPMEIEAYLNCHRRKLHILTVAAGMVLPASHKALHKNSMSKTTVAFELDSVENMQKHWNHIVAEEVKAIFRSASHVKNFIDQNESFDGLNALASTIADIQSLLLTVMCNIVGVLVCQKPSGFGMENQAERLESQCFLDAAVAFCKLQHLNPTIPVKTQVELIVAIHELLAEHGLCCAGKDSEGEKGTFLKFAIKHLLALDMKLKSSFHSSNRGLAMKQNDDFFSHNSNEKIFLNGTKSNTVLDVGTVGVEKGEIGILDKDAPDEMTSECISAHEGLDKNGEGVKNGKDGADNKLHHKGEQLNSEVVECGNNLIDVERTTVELGIENALDQSFFCLYGLDLKCGSDSSYEDDLAIHKNTNRGDYQTKEQCADVFQYILPYAKASSRSGLVKLRRVLRAIRKHFPQPPEDMLKENAIEKFLDNPDLCEEKLFEVVGSDGNLESIVDSIFPNGKGIKNSKTVSAGSSEPYLEVYGNLYYFLAQAEEMSATDKWPGFVLTKEGEDFVEQNANLFKYDLLCNPLRFESWQRLANIYDEEVDLLLNDGSKHINVVEWRKHATLPRRVETSRRRSRRCLLMSLALAKTPVQQSQIHELLALVYYDSLQNVVPFYDQRSVVATKDASWTILCQNSMEHFMKAFQQKPDWSHAFYLGKLCEKLGYPCEKALSYYSKAVTLNPSAVDPVYRMHASRLKLLYTCEKQKLDALQIVTAYCFSESAKECVRSMFGWTDNDLQQLPIVIKGGTIRSDSEKTKNQPEFSKIEEAWHILYSDCLSALEVCVEGELKHFHKARYMLAQGLYKRGESGDLERAKDELSFCFRSSRSSFTINMWEIDGIMKKARRKTPGLGGSKRGLEISLPESSRKFITCIRKYTMLYLNLLERTGDFCTLDRAYTSLRTDKRFSLCLEDIAPVALTRYIQALTLSICHTETLGSGSVNSLDLLLERMFNLFMEHGNLWTDKSSLPEMNSPELSENSLYSYIHRYIHSLERDVRLETLEGINEKIRKRFKNPKLSNSNFAKICKHASVAWCHSILISLALITPLHVENPNTQDPTPVTCGSENGMVLYVDIQANELWSSSEFGDPTHPKALEMKWSHMLSKIKNVQIKQATEENIEAAASLLRCAYNFYRESPCGTLPSGINLYIGPSRLAAEGPCPPAIDGVDTLDLSIPRKLLLWAYTLVHGRYLNILAVVKHCEENAKSRVKRGIATSSALPHTSGPTCTPHTGGGGKERTNQDQFGEAEDNPSTAVASNLQGDGVHGSNMASCSTEGQKTVSAISPLHPCNNTNAERIIQNGHEGKKDTD
ncbi:tetratricopeptide repeat (TPR)-like superfamily protein isoform X2 [Tasmannia lanceolata]|uniref:tetratricopeptide repeat (TPR)-like superfamily protein isoform X2 n=1 Tax=Tasmannia lanceolata TaxID=3420 RepID=UPI004063C25C